MCHAWFACTRMYRWMNVYVITMHACRAKSIKCAMPCLPAAPALAALCAFFPLTPWCWLPSSDLHLRKGLGSHCSLHFGCRAVAGKSRKNGFIIKFEYVLTAPYSKHLIPWYAMGVASKPDDWHKRIKDNPWQNKEGLILAKDEKTNRDKRRKDRSTQRIKD